MDTLEYPRPLLLFKSFLDEQLSARSKPMTVSSKDPVNLPERWIRVESNGGPRDLSVWTIRYVVYINDHDESLGESNAVLIHGLTLDAPGVEFKLTTNTTPFPWVVRARHVSGPSSIGNADIPQLSVYRFAVEWSIHPIPYL
jgi:hypothetical protein